MHVITNALVTFQRCMTAMCLGLVGNYLEIFINDFSIFQFLVMFD